MSNFITDCVEDKAAILDIDDYIDKWHESDGEEPLYEFLGMTREQWVLFIHSDSSLVNIINEYKQKIKS